MSSTLEELADERRSVSRAISALSVWTSVRAEDRLIAEIRAALGAHRFDDAVPSGLRVSRSEAVAVAQLDPQATVS